MATLQHNGSNVVGLDVLAHRQHELVDHDLVRPRLSDREKQVLRTWLLCDSKPLVARSLYLSLGTVNTHLSRIRSKYEAVGRAAATKAALAARALQDGIITLDEL